MLSTSTALRKDKNSASSSMEHRHFATIAAIIASMDLYGSKTVRNQVAAHFANELAATNPKFDRARFIRACDPNA